MPTNANIMPMQEIIPFHQDYLRVAGGHRPEQEITRPQEPDFDRLLLEKVTSVTFYATDVKSVSRDTLGLVWGVHTHAANLSDTDEAIPLFRHYLPLLPRTIRVYLDKGYRGTAVLYLESLDILAYTGQRAG